LVSSTCSPCHARGFSHVHTPGIRRPRRCAAAAVLMAAIESEFTAVVEYRDLGTKPVNRYTDRKKVSRITTFGKCQPYCTYVFVGNRGILEKTSRPVLVIRSETLGWDHRQRAVQWLVDLRDARRRWGPSCAGVATDQRRGTVASDAWATRVAPAEGWQQTVPGWCFAGRAGGTRQSG